jgi:hypothetical protein
MSFNSGSRNITLKIAGVDIADNRSTREYRLGLTFVYDNEEQCEELETLKLKEQIVNIGEQNKK